MDNLVLLNSEIDIMHKELIYSDFYALTVMRDKYTFGEYYILQVSI